VSLKVAERFCWCDLRTMRNRYPTLGSVFVMAFTMLAMACDGTPEPATDPCEATHLGIRLGSESGFVEIARNDYEKDGEARTSDAFRMWYGFSPAAEGVSAEAPLFVLFNGGPGGTSLLMAAAATGPRALRLSEGQLCDNPTPWTTLGPLLYLDARQTGFSYQILDRAADAASRGETFSARNYDAYVDAADMLRGLLAFLAAHPEHRTRPVVFVGESYAGVRIELMLHFLLDPLGLSGEAYRDPALASDVDAELVRRQLDPTLAESRASLVRAQVLLQPQIDPSRQDPLTDRLRLEPTSPWVTAAREAGMSFTCTASTCALSLEAVPRDPYFLNQPPSYSGALVSAVTAVVHDLASIDDLLGVDTLAVDGLTAAGRAGAFRLGDQPLPVEPQSIQNDRGALPAHDRYWVALHRSVRAAFGNVPASDVDGTALLCANLARIPTMITDAAWDGVILSRAIPILLADTSCGGRYDASAQTMTVDTALGERVVAMPHFARSGHTIGLSEPAELRAAIDSFLQEEVSR
jgi:hypothetical protein